MGDAAQSTSRVHASYEVAASVGPLPPGLLLLALSTDFTRMKSSHEDDCPDLGPTCGTAKPPTPYNHNLVNYAYGLTLDAQLGVLSWLTLATSIPYRAITTDVHYTDLAGRDYAPVPPDVHHRNRTITGLGDPTLLVVIGRALGRLGFSVRLGASLPFGRTLDADPFRLGDEGLAHEHVQFGTGTLRPIAGSAIGYDFGPIGVDAWFGATLSLAANSIGYRPGQRFSGGLRVTSALGTSVARFGLGLEAARESTETWSGLQPGEGNLGRTDVLAVASARWSAAKRWGLFGTVKIPAYVNAIGAQLTYPLIVQLGIATGFDL